MTTAETPSGRVHDRPRFKRTTVRVAQGGRIVIPAEFRKALGLEVGDTLTLVLEGNEFRLLTPMEAIRQAKEYVQQLVPGDRSLADELIAERRAEAARE